MYNCIHFYKRVSFCVCVTCLCVFVSLCMILSVSLCVRLFLSLCVFNFKYAWTCFFAFSQQAYNTISGLLKILGNATEFPEIQEKFEGIIYSSLRHVHAWCIHVYMQTCPWIWRGQRQQPASATVLHTLHALHCTGRRCNPAQYKYGFFRRRFWRRVSIILV